MGPWVYIHLHLVRCRYFCENPNAVAMGCVTFSVNIKSHNYTYPDAIKWQVFCLQSRRVMGKEKGCSKSNLFDNILLDKRLKTNISRMFEQLLQSFSWSEYILCFIVCFEITIVSFQFRIKSLIYILKVLLLRPAWDPHCMIRTSFY